MKPQKSSVKVLKELIQYIIESLEDLANIHDSSQFVEGEMNAYVDCLELVSKWTSYHKFGIKNIEQRFPID